MCFKTDLLIFISIVIFINIACSSENDLADHLSMNSFVTLPLETVFEFTESDEVAFHFIQSMKADAHGNVLVSDSRQSIVFMFDTEGNFIQQIGEKGQGPGEFQNVSSFFITYDSLFVSDNTSLKIEIFEYRNSKYTHAHTMNMNFENPRLLGTLLGLTESGIIVKNDIWLSPFIPNNPTETAISLFSYDGNLLQDTLFSVPVYEFVTVNAEIAFVGGKIFGNSSMLAFDGESRIYSLWTEALNVNYFTLEGQKHHAFSYSLKPVTITKAERDSALNLWEGPQRNILEQHMPEVKPVADRLLVDDQQRVWIELMTKELGHGWFAFTKDGKPLFCIKMPRHSAILQDIRGNTVLWNYFNEHGAPTIVKSKIEIPESYQ